MTLAEWGTVALIASVAGAFLLWAWRRFKGAIDRFGDYIVRKTEAALAPEFKKVHDRIDAHMTLEEQDREEIRDLLRDTREDVATIAGHTGTPLRERR